MASMRIHGAVVVVAVIFLNAFLPSHASTAVDEPSQYTHKAPTPAPVPSPSSYSPPTPPPIQPVIVVQGVIYCKSCKLSGYNSDMDASPLPNATVALVCYGGEDTKYRVLNQTSTPSDRTGYFVVMVYDLEIFDRHSCRLYLRSSPTRLCAAPFVPSNPKLGLTVVREQVGSLPSGVRGVYHPRTALMYSPGRGGKCPPY